MTRGKGLQSAFADSRFVTPAVSQMIRTGEESGALGQVMGLMADHYEEETETLIKDATTMLEPLIIVVMGLVVGFIAISLVSPLFNLSAVARGG